MCTRAHSAINSVSGFCAPSVPCPKQRQEELLSANCHSVSCLPPSLPLFHQHLLNAYNEPVNLGVKALRSTTLITGSDISAVAKGVAAWWS